jgi:hypothetical protein
MVPMAEKATFRLPEWELKEMRERSRRERRSLNSVVADVIAVGLGRAPAPEEDAFAAALGPLLVRRATKMWTGADWDPSPVQLTDALDWTRGDR